MSENREWLVNIGISQNGENCEFRMEEWYMFSGHKYCILYCTVHTRGISWSGFIQRSRSIDSFLKSGKSQLDLFLRGLLDVCVFYSIPCFFVCVKIKEL
jgi:hypothetical protein